MFIERGVTRSRQTPSDPLYINTEKTAPGYGPPSAPPNYGYGTLWYPHRKRTIPLGGIQTTESDNNRWPPPKGGTSADLGSEFYTRKSEIVNSKFPTFVSRFEPYPPGDLYGSFPYRYRSVSNMMIANGFNDGVLANCNMTTIDSIVKPAFPPDLSSSRSQLNVKGAIAVAATSPSNQIANAASAVGELLQDVPNIPGLHLLESRLRVLEAAARSSDEFLNIVFGVLPTISDTKAFVEGVSKVEKRVDQFIKDSGRNVRRKMSFPMEKTTTTEVLPGIYSPVGMFTIGGDGYSRGNVWDNGRCRFPLYATVRERTIEREMWFSGAFTYHLPSWFDTTSKGDRRLLMAKLLGGQPDLNTLWQLTPWSWAVDWFTNASSWVKSVQALISYGQVLRYGYIMEKTTVTDTYSAGSLLALPDPACGPLSKPYPAVHPITLRTTVKKRVRANPFGFGIDWNGLSPVQLAITAALGITRVVR